MPRNKYPEETVQKILDASLKLFLEKGYEQTKVLDIVDHLGGLSRGAFYHHFKTKEEVLDVLIQRLFRENNSFQLAMKETDLNGLEKIQKAIKLQFSNVKLQTLNIVSMPLLKNPRFLAEVIEQNLSATTPYLQTLIEEGIADGSIEHISARPLAELFMFIGNLWLAPSVYPSTKQEFLDKIYFSKELLDRIGFPVFDDEIFAYVVAAADNLDLE